MFLAPHCNIVCGAVRSIGFTGNIQLIVFRKITLCISSAMFWYLGHCKNIHIWKMSNVQNIFWFWLWINNNRFYIWSHEMWNVKCEIFVHAKFLLLVVWYVCNSGKSSWTSLMVWLKVRKNEDSRATERLKTAIKSRPYESHNHHCCFINSYYDFHCVKKKICVARRLLSGYVHGIISSTTSQHTKT